MFSLGLLKGFVIHKSRLSSLITSLLELTEYLTRNIVTNSDRLVGKLNVKSFYQYSKELVFQHSSTTRD